MLLLKYLSAPQKIFCQKNHFKELDIFWNKLVTFPGCTFQGKGISYL